MDGEKSYLLELPAHELEQAKQSAVELNMSFKAYISRCFRLMALVDRASQDGALVVKQGQSEIHIWLL